MQCDYIYYDKAPLHYTPIGTINMANTYDIDGYEIIVSLGTGRVYERK